MATPKRHLIRTADDPRAATPTSVTLSAISVTTPSTRLLTLSLPSPLPFQPGQWLDVWLPGIADAGGFTIVSSPRAAVQPDPYLQLAVRLSPKNPPAAWLWREAAEIQGAQIDIRVGGRFIWPPPAEGRRIDRVVFVAGGVGVNPFVSMVRALYDAVEGLGALHVPAEVVLLYGCRAEDVEHGEEAESVLFGGVLGEVFARRREQGWRCTFYLTGDTMGRERVLRERYGQGAEVRLRRISEDDAAEALGPAEARGGTVVYVCGPQAMTDSFVEALRTAEGMGEERVLCEKWW